MMKWNHLPWPGGLYDQHPKLLDDFYLIFVKKGEYEERKHKQQMAAKPKQAAGRRRAARRR